MGYRPPYPFDPIDPPDSGSFVTPKVWLQMPVSALGYIQSALDNTLYDNRAWVGTSEQVETAIEFIEDAMTVKVRSNLIVNIRVVGCELQVMYANETEWTPIGDFSMCGAQGEKGDKGDKGDRGDVGPTGATGSTGSTGATGAKGDTGEKGDKGDKGDRGADGADSGKNPPDTTTPEDDPNQHLCAVAQGLAEWTCDKFHASIETIRASVDAARGIFDQATDLLDAVPVIGAIVNNVLDFVNELSTAGDFDDILGFIDDPTYRSNFACQIYCALKASSQTEFTKANVLAAMNTASIWNVHLPLGLPFLTAYGPAMGLFIQCLDYGAIFTIAVVHLDETSNDCELLCDECADPQEGDVMNWHVITTGDPVYSRLGAGKGIPDGTGWIFEHVGDKYKVTLTTDAFDFSVIDGKRIRVITQFYADGDYGHTAWDIGDFQYGYVWDTDNNWYPMPKTTDGTVTLDATEHVTLATTTNASASASTPSTTLYLAMTSYNQPRIVRIELVDA